MGVIKHATRVLEDGEDDIAHEEGQVILLTFYASWCKYSKIALAELQSMAAS